MDSRQAREILLLYRPGTTDAADPQIAEALEFAKNDAELSAWFEQHCAVYSAIHGKFKSIPIPRDLKRKIIIEKPAEPRMVQMPGVMRWLAAAAAIIILGVVTWSVLSAAKENTFAVYRTRMITKIAKGYFMDFQATNQTEIRDYFAKKNASVDYELPRTVQQLSSDGCALFTFNNRPVELICLYDTLPTGNQKNPVWVFVTKKSYLPDAPKAEKPEYYQFEGLATATWATGDSLYFLASRGERKDLEKYFQ